MDALPFSDLAKLPSTDYLSEVSEMVRRQDDAVPTALIIVFVGLAFDDLLRDEAARSRHTGLPRHVTSELISDLQQVTDNRITKRRFEELFDLEELVATEDSRERDKFGRRARRYCAGKTSLKFDDAHDLLITFAQLANLLSDPATAAAALEADEIRIPRELLVNEPTSTAENIFEYVIAWRLRLIALEVVSEYRRDVNRRWRQAKTPRDYTSIYLTECCARFRKALRVRFEEAASRIRNAKYISSPA